MRDSNANLGRIVEYPPRAIAVGTCLDGKHARGLVHRNSTTPTRTNAFTTTSSVARLDPQLRRKPAQRSVPAKDKHAREGTPSIEHHQHG